MFIWREKLYWSLLSTHQTTVKPTTVIIVDFVAASFIVVAAAFTYHQCKHRYGAHVGGSKSNAVNLILRLFLYHILHTMSS
jgi:hypothetical protein